MKDSAIIMQSKKPPLLIMHKQANFSFVMLKNNFGEILMNLPPNVENLSFKGHIVANVIQIYVRFMYFLANLRFKCSKTLIKKEFLEMLKNDHQNHIRVIPWMHEYFLFFDNPYEMEFFSLISPPHISRACMKEIWFNPEE